jgi:hypothetical protein
MIPIKASVKSGAKFRVRRSEVRERRDDIRHH